MKMESALTESQAILKQEAEPNCITITATVDGVAREVVLTESQMFPAYRVLQDMYDQEDVKTTLTLEESMFQEMKPPLLDMALKSVPEIAAAYREALDKDEWWYNILQSVVLHWMRDHNPKNNKK